MITQAALKRTKLMWTGYSDIDYFLFISTNTPEKTTSTPRSAAKYFWLRAYKLCFCCASIQSLRVFDSLPSLPKPLGCMELKKAHTRTNTFTEMKNAQRDAHVLTNLHKPTRMYV